QLRLCPQAGIAPISISTSTIKRIVPNDIFSSSKVDTRTLRAAGDGSLRYPASAAQAMLLYVQRARAEQTKQSDHDQIDRHDVIQKSRHHQDQDAGDQRNQRADAQVQVH